MPRSFLTAEWRNLLMINFTVDPELLRPLVPRGTELDQWNGHTYVSVVGFLFANTRVLGVSIPGHTTFEEINLRFYVRRETGSEVRRGVTFIRELVPRPAIALTARALYNEPYSAVPMRHKEFEYAWRNRHGWTTLTATIAGEGQPATPGGEEEFITEHFWGYTRQRDGGTVEYKVEHPSWKIWSATSTITGNAEPDYGRRFAEIIRGAPSSAFVADGSAVTVYSAQRIS